MKRNDYQAKIATSIYPNLLQNLAKVLQLEVPSTLQQVKSNSIYDASLARNFRCDVFSHLAGARAFLFRVG